MISTYNIRLKIIMAAMGRLKADLLVCTALDCLGGETTPTRLAVGLLHAYVHGI